jgi:hypothetical protein
MLRRARLHHRATEASVPWVPPHRWIAAGVIGAGIGWLLASWCGAIRWSTGGADYLSSADEVRSIVVFSIPRTPSTLGVPCGFSLPARSPSPRPQASPRPTHAGNGDEARAFVLRTAIIPERTSARQRRPMSSWLTTSRTFESSHFCLQYGFYHFQRVIPFSDRRLQNGKEDFSRRVGGPFKEASQSRVTPLYARTIARD